MLGWVDVIPGPDYELVIVNRLITVPFCWRHSVSFNLTNHTFSCQFPHVLDRVLLTGNIFVMMPSFRWCSCCHIPLRIQSVMTLCSCKEERTGDTEETRRKDQKSES